MPHQINIVADYREVPSKIHDILEELGVGVKRRQLQKGDYIINGELLVERKSREDFVLSIIQGRLFSQCAAMKKSGKHSLLLIEETLTTQITISTGRQ